MNVGVELQIKLSKPCQNSKCHQGRRVIRENKTKHGTAPIAKLQYMQFLRYSLCVFAVLVARLHPTVLSKPCNVSTNSPGPWDHILIIVLSIKISVLEIQKSLSHQFVHILALVSASWDMGLKRHCLLLASISKTFSITRLALQSLQLTTRSSLIKFHLENNFMSTPEREGVI